ncbi:MAG: phospho-sugar mutase [Simkaniaceae bacterium]|nr:phospho-sugar mutase [Simkaniaceae bacterium]
MSRDIASMVDQWLKGDYDNETKQEILKLQTDAPQMLRDAFYKDLEFGTGGMRGQMGVGTNRLNIYTIGRATQSLANYINDNLRLNNHLSVVICYDSRHHSHEFALYAARVLAGNQIHVWMSPELRPTPFTSFMVRQKGAVAGIMITASHNPSEYNGYKVYGPDGAQVVPPHDCGIIQEYEKIKSLDEIRLAAENSPLIHTMTAQDDDAFIEAITHLQIHQKESLDFGDALHILYSSLHGCGMTLMPKALKACGLTHISFVKSQVIPDGDFPTVKKPNPEELPALQMGIDQMQKEKCDLFIATDPDADRVGVVVMHQNKPVVLTGNEIASICLYHLANTLQQKGGLTKNHTVLTTIVTTRLLKKIAADFNLQYFDLLTGFKYIGEKIHQFEEESNPHQFLFGAEESYGYLMGTHSRDKDSFVTSCFIGQMALHLKLKGLTLIDQLYDIYQRYGIHREGQVTIALEDSEAGARKKDAIMNSFRDPNLTAFADMALVQIDDYKIGKGRHLMTGETYPLHLPKSDTIVFKCDDESEIIVRPSGTEPKIKIYGLMQLKSFLTIEKGINDLDTILKSRLTAIREQFHQK